ncbi:MAG: hypothetical protein IKO47_09265 [Ruminococcus sp.]|nr:hypothetical protein [Ruminococcus sp.]
MLFVENTENRLTQEQFAEKIDKNLAFIGAVEALNVNKTVSLKTLFHAKDFSGLKRSSQTIVGVANREVGIRDTLRVTNG